MATNYKFKSDVLQSGLPQRVNQIEKVFYARMLLETTGEIIHTTLDYDTAQKEWCFLLQNYPNELKEAQRINSARYKRVSRLRSYISRLLRESNTVIFVTLTFSDETLSKTSEDTRRQKVRRYLSQFSDNYVANKDFGGQKGREHYHAVIDCEIDLEQWKKNGHILAEYVKAPNDVKTAKKPPKRYKDLPLDEQRRLMSIDDEKRLSKYIAKLTNHAIKETCKGSHIIYGRTKPNVNCNELLKNNGYVYTDKKGKIIALVPTEENLPF